MIQVIKTIELNNFQSHAHTELVLDSGVNLFTGESNNGKSAILRGLLWLATNKPSGIGFVSSWAKEKNSKGDVVLKKNAACSVAITVIDSNGAEHTIKRIRTRDSNLYVLDSEEFEAMGAGVPDPIIDLLSLHDCNIQAQDDTYYLLTLPAGQVASKLNELVHLDDIDTAYSYNKGCKTAQSAILREYTSCEATTKLKLDGYKHLPQLVEDAKALTELVDTYDEEQDKLQQAEECLGTLLSCKQKLEQIVSVPDTDISMLTDLLDDHCTLKAQYDKANGLLWSMTNNEDALKRLTAVEETEVTSVCAEVNEYLELVQKSRQATTLLCNYDNVQQELHYVDITLSDLLNKMPEICPTCGQALHLGV